MSEPRNRSPELNFAAQRTMSRSAPSSEGRDFLAARVRTFNMVVLGLGLLFFTLITVARMWKEPGPFGDWFFGACNALNLLQVLVNVALILVLSKWRLQASVLRYLDVGGTFVLASICAAYGWAEHFIPAQEYHGLLAVSNMLVLRAFLVPGSPRVALLLASASVLPGFVPAVMEFGVAEGASAVGPALKVAVFLSWSLITVVLSVFAVRVVYGLRREVKEAQQLGQYRLEEKIGEGGMGAVYRASHALLRRPTAIKILATGKFAYDDFKRFEREVQITSELTHPNTIGIFDYGSTDDGVFYYAMEYLAGFDLQQLVAKHGAQHPARVIHILTQVLGSLQEAHDRGLVHRDIKPANIILCSRGGIYDFAKVLDFGLVKPPVDDPAHVPGESESLIGTPRYLSPEAIENPSSADARSDLYALGAVGYYLLTGSHVFQAKTVAELLRQQVEEAPEAPSLRLGCSVPTDLEKVLLLALAKDPAERPATAAEFSRALSRCVDARKWGDQEASMWWHQNAMEIVNQMKERGGGQTSRVAIPNISQNSPTMRVGPRKTQP
ncbi:MAG: serine/threonine-protein kinase [Planctomycetota bacterium]